MESHAASTIRSVIARDRETETSARTLRDKSSLYPLLLLQLPPRTGKEKGGAADTYYIKCKWPQIHTCCAPNDCACLPPCYGFRRCSCGYVSPPICTCLLLLLPKRSLCVWHKAIPADNPVSVLVTVAATAAAPASPTLLVPLMHFPPSLGRSGRHCTLAVVPIIVEAADLNQS